jgi:pimeloyl-ACP methyl ester carboxylesterase
VGEYSAFSDGLLVDELREFARESITTSVAGLARAASESFEDIELATAFADLCVTGRNAFEKFRTERPTVEQIVEALRLIRAGTDEDLESAAEWVLRRALVVANALRTGVGRETLGWVAVCGNEDPPHRPVNVPVTEYPQFDLNVRVEPIALRNQTVRTRAMIAIGEPTEVEPAVSDSLADDPTPTIDLDVSLVLFLHGHSSRLEEAESLIRPFTRRGFGVVAIGLPSSGYSESIPHDRIEEENPEPLITDNPSRYFVLEFHDAFVHAFVNALSDSVGFDVSRQIVLVIGGSLGGNLSLRLASASPFNKPYAANVSAWSPASVWTPSDDDVWRNLGPKKSAERAWEDEGESTRESYFFYTWLM